MKIFNPSKDRPKLELLGGKAYNLAKYNIKSTPCWFCLTCEFFESWLNGERGQAIVLNKDYKKEDISEIYSMLKKGAVYAVRSSAIDEDGSENSFAGINESFLNVQYNEVLQKIKECYLSAFSQRAINYRKANGLSTVNIKMAVIVQEMIDSDFAGVANTINPITNNPDEILISVLKGQGEKLVSGQENSTDYIINGNVITTNGDALLSKKNINDILLLCKEVQSKSNKFQDIEFAIKNNKIYFLQTRDITPYRHIDISQARVTLDNSNIIESYNGAVTDLTFSFAREIYQKVYTQTLKLAGLKEGLIDALTPSLADMLRFYNNRIYYNMNSWYHITAILPTKKSTDYMENMMGVATKITNVKKEKLSFLQVLQIAVIFMKKLKSIDNDSNIFTEKFDKTVMPKIGCTFDNMSLKEIKDYYQILESEILDHFTTPVINDCGAMFYMGMLKKMVSKFDITDKEGYIASLMAKQGNVESAMSAPMFMDIVEHIKSDPKIENDFKYLSSEKLKEKYLYNSPISPYINKYIVKFGSRVMDELKLETITLVEDPTYLFEMLKGFVAKGLTFNTQDQMKSYSYKVSTLKRRRFNKLVNKTRFFIKNRERLRLKRTYIFSVVRNMFLAIGRHFVKEEIIDNYRDIFFLKKDEIFKIIDSGKYISMQLIIERRKLIYEKNREKEFASRIVFYGDNSLSVQQSHSQSDNKVLKGTPSGAGVVQGEVNYVTKPQEAFAEGKIILAYRTDPGWVVLFPLCKGLVVERGSVLSHSAVVAREMGIPAVVGVAGATKIIKDKSVIKVDGIKGEVHLDV